MWNTETENKCKEICNRAGAFVWLYKESANYMSSISNKLSIFTIVATYLLGTSGIPILFAYSANAAKYGNFVIQLSMIFLGIVGTICKALNFNDKISKYNYVCAKNQALFNKIKVELSKPIEKRGEFDKFYGDIINLENEVHRHDVVIPKKVLEKYFAKMKPHVLTYNELFLENMQEVVIGEDLSKQEKQHEQTDKLITHRSILPVENINYSATTDEPSIGDTQPIAKSHKFIRGYGHIINKDTNKLYELEQYSV